MKKSTKAALLAASFGVMSVAPAHAAFVNGNFETGNTNGWTLGTGSRAGYYNSTYGTTIQPDFFLPGGANYDPSLTASHSQVIGTSYVDPNVGAALGTTVYNGNYSLRLEDTTTGGYASVIEQKVTNYQDPDISFAWKAVLLGAHSDYDAATMIIKLTDTSTGTDLITREYNAASGGSGIDPRFSNLNGNYYTAAWQEEYLNIDASLKGHDFLLTILAADCQPTGHWGYVYLDGIGTGKPPVVVPPNNGVPEPASWAMMIAGFGLTGAAMRRRNDNQKVALA